MSLRSFIILALGLVIAIGTSMSLRGRMHAPQAPDPLSQVLVATADISAGSFVRSETQLVLMEWPKDHITAQMVTGAEGASADYNGAVARRTIQKGEPILKNTLVRSHEGGFMSAVLEPGKRAVSIAVDSTSGNAGFIFPGDRVDMILTHSITHTNQTPTRASETFIEDARVLAVDQSLDNPENKAVLAKTVTLEVTPKQAEEINVAKDLGKISLSLRSLSTTSAQAADAAPTLTERTIETLDDILRENTPETNANSSISNVTRDTDVSKMIAPNGVAGSRVMVIRGNERSEIIFGQSEGDARAN